MGGGVLRVACCLHSDTIPHQPCRHTLKSEGRCKEKQVKTERILLKHRRRKLSLGHVLQGAVLLVLLALRPTSLDGSPLSSDGSPSDCPWEAQVVPITCSFTVTFSQVVGVWLSWVDQGLFSRNLTLSGWMQERTVIRVLRSQIAPGLRTC